MQTRSFIFMLYVLLLAKPVNAQSFNQLNNLPGHSVQVYYSKGFKERAFNIANRVDNAMVYYQQLLDFRPTVNFLVLDTSDWSKYTSFPVYGMPHYSNDNTLVVPAVDNPFWKSFIPPLDQLPADLRSIIQDVYKNDKGEISMQAFFDLLALHELGHAFHFQGGLNMQRKWLQELFVNILLHTYIAENEPAALPALSLFPNMVVGSGSQEYKYTSLKDIEDKYDEIGKLHPKNYGWYQCRWHLAAASIYDSGGKPVPGKLWHALKASQGKMDDEQLAVLLSAVNKTLGDVMKNWDKDTK